MKKILLLIGILFCSFACTNNQFNTEVEIEAEILSINNDSMSIRYVLAGEEVLDDIVLKALAQKLLFKNKNRIQLKLVAYARDNDDTGKSATAKYYYGVNLIGESKVFKDYDTLFRVANKNPDLFTWEVKDGNVKTIKQKHKVPEGKFIKNPEGKVEKL